MRHRPARLRRHQGGRRDRGLRDPQRGARAPALLAPATPAFVALLLVHLHFPAAGDLKGKRKELASLKSQLQGRLGAAVAEVDHQDRWQRATLSAALTAGTLDQLERSADRLERFVLDRHPEGASFERHVASIEDLRG